MFSENEINNIDIHSYLKKCGVNDTYLYLNPNGNVLEDTNNYDNIDKCCEILYKYLIGGDV